MLIVFGGLPGTGKTTISRAVASGRSATWLRIDTIEQAIRDANVLARDVGPAGYFVANAVAEANLRNGRVVVVDCVNPVAESRVGWRGVAARAAVPIVEVEVICSDAGEHRRRVEARRSDIAGLILPTWRDVVSHDYQTWDEPHAVLDTAGMDEAAAIRAAQRLIGR